MDNIIQTPQKTENKASEILKKAEKDALSTISNAKKEKEAEISSLKDSIRKEMDAKKTSQKELLAKKYQDILKKGVTEIITPSDTAKKKAVDFLLLNI